MSEMGSVAEAVTSLYPKLITGAVDVICCFADRATVDSPLEGRQQPAEFVAATHPWLDRHDARAEDVHTVVTPERVIHEIVLRLVHDGEDRELPVMLVAEAEDGLVRDLRIYHSTWPLTGSHLVRRPLMQYDLAERPPEPVGTYHDALAEGDAARADSAFEPGGCVREPAGGEWVHCGESRTQWYRDILSRGPIVLHIGTITDDGVTVVYEYAADRWGEPMLAQAGAAAYERGAGGRLASARIYDDIAPPALIPGE